MANFTVTFQLKSYYDNETNDMTDLVKKDFDVKDLNELFDLLDDTEELDSIDDTSVLNKDTEEEPDEINIEYVVITDQDSKEVYRDEDFEG